MEEYCELSAGVRKAGIEAIQPGRVIRGFGPEEEFVPFVVFAGSRGADAREGLVEQLCIGDVVDFHPAPLGIGRCSIRRSGRSAV